MKTTLNRPNGSEYALAEILQLRSEGWTCSQIGKKYDRSVSRINQLIRKDFCQKLAIERSKVICATIQSSSDLDTKLGIKDLLCVLNLSLKTEGILRKYFNGRTITEFSLREMMDFLIPCLEKECDLYKHMPAYRIKGLGQINYACMIRGMSAIDCFVVQVEWTARKKHLRDFLRETKGRYPYILHGRNPALAWP